MKHKIFATLLLLFSTITLIHAQWSVVNVANTTDLYSVDYYNANTVWIGSFNKLLKTSDGTNWSIITQIKDGTNTQIPSNLNDIALTTTNTAVGVGVFYGGNNECIFYF